MNDNPKPTKPITVEQCLGEMLDCLRSLEAAVVPPRGLADVIAAIDDGVTVARTFTPEPEPLAEWERELLDQDSSTAALLTQINANLNEIRRQLDRQAEAMSAAVRGHRPRRK